ncbi:helix-turn-helix domain-containing protein [Fructilactobacillus sp. Tb1]|uniref:helix-turn-helix domain-containing protein n=1 Tax=Fructilactobacillus sp. Tb1 TaxID=3422304 RepID=UPI003D2AC0E8
MKLNEELAIILLNDKQPRRKRLLENLLGGKKTVATLYWALRYQLLGYLGLGRYLDISELHLSSLIKQKLVKKTDDEYLLTKTGMNLKAQLLDSQSPQWQHNFQNYNLVRFKYRLLLFVQVISEFEHHERNYYPVKVPDAEMNYVKHYFKTINRENVGISLKNELVEFLNSLDDSDADLFANELVGYQNNGKTLFQIAADLNKSLIAISLSDLTNLSKLINIVSNQEQSVLKPLLNGLNRTLVSESALLTVNQYLSCHDLSMVAKRRRLKESTIYEHLLEVAIYSGINKFPYQDFITKQITDQLTANLGKNIDSWKYESLSDIDKQRLSFFQFRLSEIYLTKLEIGK